MFVLLALVAFTLPFKDEFLVNFFIVVSAAVWLFSKPFGQLFAVRRNIQSLIAISAFYLLHVIGLLYTHNLEEAFSNLEIKVTLLIFPLIFYSMQYGALQNKFLLKNFIAGCLLCCALCLFRSAYLSITEEKNYFFYQYLSWFQHPSYLAMYLTFCCIAMFEWLLYDKRISIALSVFFTVFVVLLSSKAGILIHFLSLSVYFVSSYFSERNYKKLFLFVVSGGLLLGLSIVFFPPLKERFDNVAGAFKTDKVDKGATESTAVRMLIWNESISIIKEHPLLGVSPGDANDTLYGKYQKNGLTGAYAKRLNAHSQYFQTGVSLGWVGLLSFLFVLAIPFLNRSKKLVVFFLVICAVNFLTESMLQTMAGCIFFGYFYAMLAFEAEPDKT